MMTEGMAAKLKHLIVGHEGYERYPYVDSVGKISIGIGYNLTDRGLPDCWINAQYEEDVAYFYGQLMNDFCWFKCLDENRKCVLVDMCFMGYRNFLSFKKMLRFLGQGDFKMAAQEILSSKWAVQVKGRAQHLASIMESGEIE